MLTTKQDLFARNIIQGKSAKQSAINAGYSPKSAEVIASENLRKPNIQEKINVILDKAGLSDEKLAIGLNKAIFEGLGKKSTNADALKGIRLVFELKNLINTNKYNIVQNSNVAVSYKNLSKEELKFSVQNLYEEFHRYFEILEK